MDPLQMEDHSSQAWVEAQVAQSIDAWKLCAARSLPAASALQRERAAQAREGLRPEPARRGARGALWQRTRPSASRRSSASSRSFPRFAATRSASKRGRRELLTNSFFPVGTQLARWARSFDAELSMADTIQASRNAWICCGLQALLGRPMELTPSILAYSLLYPYSDNYLDQPELPPRRSSASASASAGACAASGSPRAIRARRPSGAWCG
jgi:hypothetical protein